MRYLLAVCSAAAWCSFSGAATLHVETFGDSLTAGFMSSTSVVSPPPLTEISQVVTDLSKAFRLKDRRGLLKYHAPSLAWPTKMVDDLTARGNKDLNLHNYAVSGHRAFDMIGQVKKSKEAETTLAYFFVGHNDVCDYYETEEKMVAAFKANFAESLKQWSKTHSKSEAYVLPVGKVDEVYRLLTGYVWKKGKDHDFTCEENWERFFPYCRANYKRLKAGTLDAFLRGRIKGMNKALEELVGEQQKKDPNNSYVFLTEAHNAAYQKEYFAVDCFHLSAKGNETLAERIAQETVKASSLGLQ